MNVLARVAIWALLLCFPIGANATGTNQAFEIGIGLICDSEAQVQRYLALRVADQSPEAAIQLINDEDQDSTACLIAVIAFIPGQEVGVVPAAGGQMKIMQITVIAAQTPIGWQRVEDLQQYTAIFEKLDEA
jgi:hypothetical protein